jgi:hypothetical protein
LPKSDLLAKGHLMTRLGFAVTLICLVAWTAGCRMCASEFDYCGPTGGGECGADCGLNAPRAGSILNGTSQAIYEDQTVYESAATGEPAMIGNSVGQLRSDDFQAPILPSQVIEGQRIDGVIISVEDHKLEDAAPRARESAARRPTPAPKKTHWSAR